MDQYRTHPPGCQPQTKLFVGNKLHASRYRLVTYVGGLESIRRGRSERDVGGGSEVTPNEGCGGRKSQFSDLGKSLEAAAGASSSAGGAGARGAREDMDEAPGHHTRYPGASFAGGTWGSCRRTHPAVSSSNRFGVSRVRGLGSAWSFHPPGKPRSVRPEASGGIGYGQRPRSRLARAELPREPPENSVPLSSLFDGRSRDHLNPSLMPNLPTSTGS